ncbi:MAG: hypothetical protein AAGC56_11730 [Pseudomonadota bacterium]
MLSPANAHRTPADAQRTPEEDGETVGTSYAEWRHDMRQARARLARADRRSAARCLRRAETIAGQLLRLAAEGRVNADCAVEIYVETTRAQVDGLADRARGDAAPAIWERAFRHLCLRAAWPCTPPALRDACTRRIDQTLAEFLGVLDGSAEKSTRERAARSIAARSRALAAAI